MGWLPRVAGHRSAALGVAPGPARRWQQRHRPGSGQGGTSGRLGGAAGSAYVLSARVGFWLWLLTTWGTPMAFMAISPLHAPITTAAPYVGSLHPDTHLYHHSRF